MRRIGSVWTWSFLIIAAWALLSGQYQIHAAEPSGNWQSIAPVTNTAEVIVDGEVHSWESAMRNSSVALRGPEPVSPLGPHENDTLESRYILQVKNGKIVASKELPSYAGQDNGDIKLIPILRQGQSKGTFEAVLNGSVWTSLVPKIGAIDLATRGPISTLPGFTLAEFRKHAAVIPFKNGYAVNLCGARVKDGYICFHQPQQVYRSSGGEGLPGRLILFVGNRVQEFLIQPGSSDLQKLPRAE